MKYLKIYENKKLSIGLLNSIIDDAFRLNNISDITKALQEIKKQYPDVKTSIKYKIIWANALDKWHDIYTNISTQNYTIPISEKMFGIIVHKLIDVISDNLQTKYSIDYFLHKGDYTIYMKIPNLCVINFWYPRVNEREEIFLSVEDWNNDFDNFKNKFTKICKIFSSAGAHVLSTISIQFELIRMNEYFDNLKINDKTFTDMFKKFMREKRFDL